METSTLVETLSESGDGASRRSETGGKSFRSRNLNAFGQVSATGPPPVIPGERLEGFPPLAKSSARRFGGKQSGTA
jgi:hypothetical protein